MRRYILLALTWCLVSASIIYLWVTDGTPPHVALWAILVVISLIPIAGRLKIGNWFEFRKKPDSEDKGILTEQERIVNIGNLNIELSNEDAARAFAERILPESKGEQFPLTETLTEEDKEVITFIYNADKAMASLLPLLRIMYLNMLIEIEKIPAQPKKLADRMSNIVNMDTLSLITEFKKNAPKILKFKDSRKQFKELLEPVETLLKLRKAIDDGKASPPPEEEAKKLVKKVHYASGFLSGIVSQGLAILFSLVRKPNSK